MRVFGSATESNGGKTKKTATGVISARIMGILECHLKALCQSLTRNLFLVEVGEKLTGEMASGGDTGGL